MFSLPSGVSLTDRTQMCPLNDYSKEPRTQTAHLSMLAALFLRTKHILWHLHSYNLTLRANLPLSRKG